jgi:hypothetical protein
VNGEWWITDYDLPAEDKAARIRFYRGLWKMLKEAHVELAQRSTQSVWISDDEDLAKKIHEWALKFGKSHLYQAKRLA